MIAYRQAISDWAMIISFAQRDAEALFAGYRVRRFIWSDGDARDVEIVDYH
jgi:hypothetical protein